MLVLLARGHTLKSKVEDMSALIAAETEHSAPKSSIQDFCEQWEDEDTDWTHDGV